MPSPTYFSLQFDRYHNLIINGDRAGPHDPAPPTPPWYVIRMPGGVGGRSRKASSYPDYAKNLNSIKYEIFYYYIKIYNWNDMLDRDSWLSGL